MNGGTVLYLTARGLTVLRWRHARLVEAVAFGPERESLEQFSRYLADERHPALLLLDLVEEEFAVETVPHARFGERRALHARRAERLFPSTPFRSVVWLGRERAGRRDDRLLISAVTRPEAVHPWMERLAAAGVPLRAISSAAHVSAVLPAALGLRGDLLLVTASGGALRQTFFHQGEMRVSRLSTPGEQAGSILDEITRTRRYLQHGALVPAASPLSVCLLADEPLLASLERVPLPLEMQVRLCTPEEVAARFGLERCAAVGAPALLAGLLLRTPHNRYAAPALRRGYRLHRARIGVEAGGLATAVALSALAFTTALHAIDARRVAVALASEPVGAWTAASPATAPLPDHLTPDQLQASVERAERLAAGAPRPRRALARVGQALLAVPEITLQGVVWSVSPDPDSSGTTGPAGSPSFVPTEGPLYHCVVLNGEIAVPGGDLRRASEEVRRLHALLQAMAEVRRVDLLTAPIDADGVITGRYGRAQPPAPARPFALRVLFHHA